MSGRRVRCPGEWRANRKASSTKILFYLPAVTPWWFETLVAPMLRRLYDEAERHVIVAPLWSNTRLEMQHVEPLADLPAINWHVVAPDDPYPFRINGADVDGLLDLINTIDPDITLARSADRHTPELFPGEVRDITAPGAEPFFAPYRWCVLDRHPFHHGVMPDELAPTADHAAIHMAPVWKAQEETSAEAHPGAARAQLGLPAHRPILAVPLQY